MPDSFLVQVSGDYYEDYSRFNVYLDGVRYGPTLAVTASHLNGENEYFGFSGDFSQVHQVAFTFINDNGGPSGKDRNLYFSSFSFNGVSQNGTAAAYNTGVTTPYAAELYHPNDTVGFNVNGYSGSNFALAVDHTANRPLFGTISYDVNALGGKVFALYEGLLNRAPDALGGESLFAQLKAGASLHDITQLILGSQEGQTRLNASDNAGFVEQLYETVLGRHGDAGGAQAWVSQLNAGASRADVANSFVFSNENVAQFQSTLNDGVFIADAFASAVARLYYGLLDRAPDAGGLQSLKDTVAQGTPLKAVAQAFLASDEYELRSTGLTDDQFIDAMYGKVLGRAGDAVGEQAWHNYLAQGGSRGGVIDGFTDSMEFQSKYAGQSNGAYVEALYEHVLGRQANASDLTYWAAPLDAHTMSRTDVAHVFSASAEFQTKYVAPSDASFVDSLYENALGRHVDTGGLQIWTNALAHGASRADVAVSIAQSPEAQQHLVSLIEAGWHLA